MTVEGGVRYERHPNGRVELTSTPRVIRVGLAELLDPVVKVAGNLVTYAGQARYRVRGWDHACHALVCDLESGGVP